jgi:hypothetical protein
MEITSEMLKNLPENLRKRIEREVAATDSQAAAAGLRTALRVLLSKMEDASDAETLRLASALPGLYSTALSARKASGEEIRRGRPIGS